MLPINPFPTLSRKSISSSLRRLNRAMSQTPRRPPKRFAPLDPQRGGGGGGGSGAPRLKGIVFDVDGTLWYVCFLVWRVGVV